MNTKSTNPLFESLETRNLFSTLAPDTGFRGGNVLTKFDGITLGATAQAGLVLKSGKLLLGGVGSDKSDQTHLLFALYNRDGNLSNSFDGDGKLVLTTAQSLIGTVQKLVQLGDGNVLVQGLSGAMKLSPTGKVDTTFGNGGVISVTTSVDDSIASANGGFRLVTTSLDGNTRTVTTYTSAGKKTGTAYAAAGFGDARFTADGGLVVVDFLNGGSTSFNVRTYDANFKPKTNFGTNGVVNVKPAFKTFVNANGPFNTPFKDSEGYPSTALTLAGVGPDGTLTLKALIDGKSDKLPFVTRGGEVGNQDTTFTLAWVTVSPDGKTVAVHGGDQTYGPGAFEKDFFPQGSNANGTFYSTAGERQDVEVDRGYTFVQGTVTDTAGSAYVFGAHNKISGNVVGFSVGRYGPTRGTITGTAFIDDNSNQTRDGNEKLNAGLTVFLDNDNDGKLDPGEVSTVTDANGKYVFPDVAVGTYRVRAAVDTTTVRTTTPQSAYFGITEIFGNETVTVPVGTTTNVWFGSQVRFDTDHSGGWSNGDKPAPGVRVWADLDKDGKYDSNEPTAVTDSNGDFHITSLKAGTYRISFAYSKPFKLIGEPHNYQDITLTSGATYSSGWTLDLVETPRFTSEKSKPPPRPVAGAAAF